MKAIRSSFILFALLLSSCTLFMDPGQVQIQQIAVEGVTVTEDSITIVSEDGKVELQCKNEDAGGSMYRVFITGLGFLDSSDNFPLAHQDLEKCDPWRMLAWFLTIEAKLAIAISTFGYDGLKIVQQLNTRLLTLTP